MEAFDKTKRLCENCIHRDVREKHEKPPCCNCEGLFYPLEEGYGNHMTGANLYFVRANRRGSDMETNYMNKIGLKYRHVTCEKCGGVIGRASAIIPKDFECLTCHEKYELIHLDFELLQINPYTGWIFPMFRQYKEA